MKYRYSLILLLLLPFVVGPIARGFTEVDTSFDQSDLRYVVGVSSNVFIGQVLEQTGFQAQSYQTWFKVRVIDNIKGSSQGNVTLHLFPGGGLQEGGTYILSAIYDGQQNEYSLGLPGHDRQLITSDAHLSDDQLKALAYADPKVIAFEQGYKNEINPFSKLGSPNSYASLPTNAKLVLEARILTKSDITNGMTALAAASGLSVICFLFALKVYRRKRVPALT